MFNQNLLDIQTRINCFLEKKISELPQDNQLCQAMSYSLLLGGKRIRPFLVYSVGEMFNANINDLDFAAAAIESIHAFSLIHDDLPAMDNDNIRRGKPTCHIKYNEALAILAGDALQSFAFELITDSQLKDKQRIFQIKSLAYATGAKGMCLGQSLDLMNFDLSNIDELEQIHLYKTGALIKSSVELGFYASDFWQDLAILKLLQRYAGVIGLAFQIQDDILDVIGSSKITGKSSGIDRQNHKTTYVSLLGLKQAKIKLQKLHNLALDTLDKINLNTKKLELLSEYIIMRPK